MTCRSCKEQPAWSEGLCTGCLQLRQRAITVQRKKAEREARRKAFYLMRRAARLGGDWELWHELRYRQRHGYPAPTNVSASAPWRARWVETRASGALVSANAAYLPHGHSSEPHSNENRR